MIHYYQMSNFMIIFIDAFLFAIHFEWIARVPSFLIFINGVFVFEVNDMLICKSLQFAIKLFFLGLGWINYTMYCWMKKKMSVTVASLYLFVQNRPGYYSSIVSSRHIVVLSSKLNGLFSHLSPSIHTEPTFIYKNTSLA